MENKCYTIGKIELEIYSWIKANHIMPYICVCFIRKELGEGGSFWHYKKVFTNILVSFRFKLKPKLFFAKKLFKVIYFIY